MTDNSATGTGGAIWFDGVPAKSVLRIERSTLHCNQDIATDAPSPGITARGSVEVLDSTIQ